MYKRQVIDRAAGARALDFFQKTFPHQRLDASGGKAVAHAGAQGAQQPPDGLGLPKLLRLGAQDLQHEAVVKILRNAHKAAVHHRPQGGVLRCQQRPLLGQGVQRRGGQGSGCLLYTSAYFFTALARVL